MKIPKKVFNFNLEESLTLWGKLKNNFMRNRWGRIISFGLVAVLDNLIEFKSWILMIQLNSCKQIKIDTSEPLGKDK